jgi:hypothetical protein
VEQEFPQDERVVVAEGWLNLFEVLRPPVGRSDDGDLPARPSKLVSKRDLKNIRAGETMPRAAGGVFVPNGVRVLEPDFSFPNSSDG